MCQLEHIVGSQVVCLGALVMSQPGRKKDRFGKGGLGSKSKI